MRIRGERECRDCGTRWSYYETGSVTCPDCGSVESRGLDDERALHTEGGADLDLGEVRTALGERPMAEAAELAKTVCREYVRQDGFLRGGTVLALDDAHLAARELVHVADLVGRSTAPTDEEAAYLRELLRGADVGRRPDPRSVPDSLRSARGLAAAEGVRAYRSELRDWLGEHPHPEVAPTLASVEQHAKRVAALQGDVAPATAERLVAAARDVGTCLREDDEAALSRARDRLEDLDAAGGD